MGAMLLTMLRTAGLAAQTELKVVSKVGEGAADGEGGWTTLPCGSPQPDSAQARGRGGRGLDCVLLAAVLLWLGGGGGGRLQLDLLQQRLKRRV